MSTVLSSGSAVLPVLLKLLPSVIVVDDKREHEGVPDYIRFIDASPDINSRVSEGTTLDSQLVKWNKTGEHGE